MTDASVIVEDKTHVLPRFAYAGFFIRLVAFVIDMIVVSGLTNILKAILPLDFALIGSLTMGDIVYWLITLAYFTLMTYYNDGQTLGKMVTNIKVVSLDGKPLTLNQVVSRETFGRYVQNKFMLIYVIAGFSPKKQSFFDMLADTTVIKIGTVDYLAEKSL